jgi:hypothetical protein
MHIPMGDGTFEILYSQHVAKNHVIDPNSPDYWSDCEYDVTPQVIEYDPWDLPFAQEDCIDTLFPKTDKYKEKLVKYQGKDPEIHQDTQIRMRERRIKSENKLSNIWSKQILPHNLTLNIYHMLNLMKETLHSCGIKRKGKPKYDKKSEILWLGPYIVKKKSEKGTYYLSSMDGRKMPLPVDGSIL